MKYSILSILICSAFMAANLPLTSAKAEARFLESVKFKPKPGVEQRIIFALPAKSAPVIDGKLDEAVWKRATVSESFRVGGVVPAKNASSLWLGCDNSAMYIGAVCQVPDPAALKRKIPAEIRSGSVWGDDCVDFKFSPDGGRTVFQFISNTNGACYDSRNGDATWNSSWSAAASVGKTAYFIEAAIPLKDLGISRYTPGMTGLLTFGRADRIARELNTAFGEPYGDVSKGATVVLGSPADYERLKAAQPVSREANLELYMDRDVYPSFQKLGTGRLRLVNLKRGVAFSTKAFVRMTLEKNGASVSSKTMTPLESAALDFDTKLAGLAPGEYSLTAELGDAKGIFSKAARAFAIREDNAPVRGEIPIAVSPAPAAFEHWPITFGVPLPWGALKSEDHIKLVDVQGTEVPIQVEVTGRWSRHGSIRWLLVDFQPPVGPRAGQFRLVYGPEVKRAAPDSAALAREKAGAVTVIAGNLKALFDKARKSTVPALWLDSNNDGSFSDRERFLDSAAQTGTFMVNEAGQKFTGGNDPERAIEIETNGPLKAVIKLSGWHRNSSGKKLGKFILRAAFYRGLPFLRLQHTFIITEDTDKVRYRGIGYSLPVRSTEYWLGTPTVSRGRVLGGPAYLLQRDDLCYKVYENGDFKEEGEKSEGWLTAGTPGRFLSVAFKDFWQQFPKELEVTRQAVNVHFWPAHAEAPVRTGKNLSIRNVYQLWFAHEGKALNFKVPEEALRFVKQDSEKYNWPNAKIANAIGLAKTHEMLIYPHTRDWESSRSREVNRVFQESPAAIVDPKWVCATRVLGNLAPRDTARFGKVEAALAGSFANIERHRKMDRDYGMFNYGDSHHNWDWQERRWSLHRIWRNTHHGWTRWPWLLFARSGQKRYLDWAKSNAYHVADVDHCHFTTKELDALPYPRGKKVGGICDYKGFVHWASGGRLHYNSIADSMVWHYYFTGNRRSLTAALEHGRALIRDGKPLPHREGAGRATSAAALYFLTWDNDYLEFLERTVDRLLGTQREDGGFPQWENFAPYLQRTVDLTQSRRAGAAMARWADWIVSRQEGARGYHSKINILAHAFLYTGEEKYMRTAAYRVSEFVDHVYPGPDPRYRGQFVSFNSNLDQSYFMQETPYYLAALDKLGHRPLPASPVRTAIRTISTEQVGGQKKYVFRLRVRKEKEGPLQLALGASGYVGEKYRAEVGLEGNPPVAVKEASPPPLGRKVTLEFALPRDNSLEYLVRVMADKNFFIRVPATSGQPELREVYPIFPGGTWVGNGFRYYFDLPTGAESVELFYKGRSWPLEMEVFDPKGNVAARDIWVGSNDLSSPDRQLKVNARGKSRRGWSFSVTGYGQARLDKVLISPETKAKEFYFAAGPKKYFQPK